MGWRPLARVCLWLYVRSYLHSTRWRYIVSINMASIKAYHCLPISGIQIRLLLYCIVSINKLHWCHLFLLANCEIYRVYHKILSKCTKFTSDFSRHLGTRDGWWILAWNYYKNENTDIVNRVYFLHFEFYFGCILSISLIRTNSSPIIVFQKEPKCIKANC